MHWISNLTASGIAVTGQQLGDLDVLAGGVLDAHTLRIALAGGEVTVGLEATGMLKDGVLREEFTQGFVILPGAQHWTLQQAAVLRLAGADIRLGAHCWGLSTAQLCLTDSWTDRQGMGGGLRLSRFPLASLAAYLGTAVALEGTAAVEIDFRQYQSDVTGTLQAGLQDAAFIYRTDGDGDDITVPISEFMLEASLTDAQLSYSGRLAAGFGLSLAAGGVVDDPFGAEPVIRGTVAGGIPDLVPISPVIERFIDIGDVRGRIELRAGLSGNPRRPDISGGLELIDGALSLPAAGVKVDRIALAILGREDGAAVIKGGARSGKGHVGVDGTVLWRDRSAARGRTRHPRTCLRSDQPAEWPGAGFAKRARGPARAPVPGEWRSAGAACRHQAEEDSRECRADRRPTRWCTAAARWPSRQAPALFVLDGLRVQLGEKVSFEGFGLKTRLTGEMSLSHAQLAGQNGVSADGVIKLEEGKFAAFGQKLDIDRGSLMFAGDVTDPGLDVKASREDQLRRQRDHRRCAAVGHAVAHPHPRVLRAGDGRDGCAVLPDHRPAAVGRRCR